MFACYIFFFNDTATTEIYTYGHTLSLHDALPISLAHECDREQAWSAGQDSSRLAAPLILTLRGPGTRSGSGNRALPTQIVALAHVWREAHVHAEPVGGRHEPARGSCAGGADRKSTRLN